MENRKIERRSTAVHGAYYRRDDGLEWWQYWRGVRHDWYWRGIWIGSRCRKRNRPMHELIKIACEGW